MKGTLVKSWEFEDEYPKLMLKAANEQLKIIESANLGTATVRATGIWHVHPKKGGEVQGNWIINKIGHAAIDLGENDRRYPTPQSKLTVSVRIEGEIQPDPPSNEFRTGGSI